MLGSLQAGLMGVPASFVPTQIAGCKLWLRGDLGITQSGGNVTAWADQSGTGNDAANSGTIPYVASSINGQPGLTIAAGTGLTGNANPVTTGSARSTFVVAKGTNAAAYSLFCYRKTGAYWAAQMNYQTSFSYVETDGVAQNNTITPGFNPGASNNIFQHGSDGVFTNPIKLWINNVSKTVTGTQLNTESGTAGYIVGNTANFTQGWVGDIAEVIVYDTDLGSTDRNSVYSYLSARYAI